MYPNENQTPPEQLSIIKRIRALPVYIVIIVVVTIVLLSGLLVLFLVKQDDPKSDKHTDHGISTISIKYGDYPYIAPCSIITPKELDSLSKGELTPSGTYAFETFYDKSVPSDRNNLRAASTQSSCSYGSADTRSDVFARIAVAHVKNANSYKELLAAIEPSRQTINEDIAALQSKLANSKDATVRKFLTTLETDKERVLTYVNSKNSQAPIGAIIPNLLVSNSDTDEQEVAFILLSKYALIRLDIVMSEKATAFNELTSSALESRIKVASELLKTASDNTVDNTLTDNDTKGILGVSKTPWGLIVLDPCSIVSDSLFTSVLGVVPNDRVMRGTFPYNKDFSRQSKSRVGYSANSCDKTYRDVYLGDGYVKTTAETTLGKNSDASIELSIGYMLDKQQAASILEQSGGVSPKPIETNADQAVKYNGQNTTVIFRKGSYYFDASLNLQGNGVTQPTDEQVVQFVNAVVAQIK